MEGFPAHAGIGPIGSITGFSVIRFPAHAGIVPIVSSQAVSPKRATSRPCPHCGYDEHAGRAHPLLPLRTVLNGQLLIGWVLVLSPQGFIGAPCPTRTRDQLN